MCEIIKMPIVSKGSRLKNEVN